MFNLFKRRVLDQEAFEAYFQRLPENIHVVWKKDNDLIVGRVEFDGSSFGTQARTPEEFINMVNEGVLLAYDTPSEYLDLIKQIKTYVPPTKGLQSLGRNDGNLTLHRDKDIADRVFA